MASTSPSPEALAYLNRLDEAFTLSTMDFARAYYLFATAKLSDTYDSKPIYDKYPELSAEETFQHLKQLFDAHPDHEGIRRMFSSVLETTMGNRLSELSDKLQNLKNTLSIPVGDLNLERSPGEPLETLMYEDVFEFLKKISNKSQRETLFFRMSDAYHNHVAPLFIDHLEQEDSLLQQLGYPDRIALTSTLTDHPLREMETFAEELLRETKDLYSQRISALYQARCGIPMEGHGNQADIAYVFHGQDACHDPQWQRINDQFPESRLLNLAQKTFDGLGLQFSSVSETIDCTTMDEYQRRVCQTTDEHPTQQRILLDVAKREGKRSRAYVYPARVPSEIYLSVKPEGGLDDYSAFFHESGHALHFVYVNPDLPYTQAQMGNNTVTEAYAYLMQNLFLNRHWLTHQGGLSQQEALTVVRHLALNDLYMLRRYASKLRFELRLFDGTGYDSKSHHYQQLLSEGTGFQYQSQGWTRDVDAGFYVADYFTAWTLEAQLRLYLAQQYGSPEVQGEDWYLNPQAGSFLKSCWSQGNINQKQLAKIIGSPHPNHGGPLVQWMYWNLEDKSLP